MLSVLQRHILDECYARGGQCNRSVFLHSAKGPISRAKEKHVQSIITRSIERLIERGLLIGYGTKTQQKLFIDTIKITPAGRRVMGTIRKEKQRTLPLRIAAKKNTSHVRNKNTKL